VAADRVVVVSAVLHPIFRSVADPKLANRPAQRLDERGVRRAAGGRTERLDARCDRRLRIHARDELLDLSLGPKPRPLERLGVPLAPEKGREHEEPGQVELPLRHHRVKLRILPNQPRRLRPAERGVLTHAKLVDTIGVERRARALAMNAARLHLSEVREQIGERHVRARGEPAHPHVKVVV
jgi:hypothetical protein